MHYLIHQPLTVFKTMVFDDIVSVGLNLWFVLSFFQVIAIIAIEIGRTIIFMAPISSLIDNLANRLAIINVLYVKLFQSVALNYDMFCDDGKHQLLRFTDNVPYTSADIDFNTLFEIEDDYQITFTSHTPINSGVISLIFKGTYADGTPVIVKMKRKSIDDQIIYATHQLIFLTKCLSYVPFINQSNVDKFVSQHISSITTQLKFEDEVENMIKFGNICNSLDYVVVPSPNRDITEKFPNVIVMNFIDGVPFDKVVRDDYECFAQQIIKFICITILIHGISHGDLHIGNILFIKDSSAAASHPIYKIGIIDFGIVFNFDDAFKYNLRDMLINLMRRPPKETAEIILNIGFFTEKLQDNVCDDTYNTVVETISQMVQTIHTDKNMNLLRIAKVSRDIYDNLNSYSGDICDAKPFHITPSANNLKIIMVLAMVQGVISKLCGDRYMDMYEKTVNELFHLDIFGLGDAPDAPDASYETMVAGMIGSNNRLDMDAMRGELGDVMDIIADSKCSRDAIRSELSDVMDIIVDSKCS